MAQIHDVLAQQRSGALYRPDGHEAAQPYFHEGLLLLHQFQYEGAIEKFQMAQLLDPDMHMAYWGEMMCYDQPIWFRHDVEKGQGVLFKMGIDSEARLSKVSAPVERGLIRSAELLFDVDKPFETRRGDYHSEMERLGREYPGNALVQCFLALSSLSMHAITWDKEFAQRALQALELVLEVQPDHPGALHYMLHAADHPNRAYRVRGVLEQYQEAVDDYYSTHLVSHHYLCTGQWGPLIEQNTTAWARAESYAEEANIRIAEIGYHIPYWKVYGLLQSGRFSEAADLIKDVRFYSRYGRSPDLLYHLIVMRAAFLIESEQWDHEIAGYDIPLSGFDVVTKSVSAYADGVAALEDGNLQRAEWYVSKISDYRTLSAGDKSGMTAHHLCHGHRVTIPVKQPADRMLAEMLELSLRAMVELERGDHQMAFEHIERASVIDSRLPYFPAPPLVVKPVQELYGDMLLEVQKPEDALSKYDLALIKNPNRTRSIIGKYRALMRMGDPEKAGDFKAIAEKLLEHADPGHPLPLD